MFEELQRLLLRTRLSMAEIASGTSLSLSLLRKLKLGLNKNPTIETYSKLKAFLEEAEANPRPASNSNEHREAA